MKDVSPFRLMNMMFLGFLISLVYGLGSFFLLYVMYGEPNAQGFLIYYARTFRTLISVGLVLGTAIIVYKTQHIPVTAIERAFRENQLLETRYFYYKERYLSRRRSVTYSSQFFIVSFILFLARPFPGDGLDQHLITLAACSEYVFGVYVGRKIFYAGLMLHSLLGIEVTRNLFKKHELDIINMHVNVISTLTIVFGLAHLSNYANNAAFGQSILGPGANGLLILPAVIGTPVLLIFNFYPRMVLRKIYSESIDVEIRNLKRRLKNRSLNNFERLSYIIEFEKQARDEMRYRLRLTLSDLPIGLTIFIMAIQIFLGQYLGGSSSPPP